MSWGSTFCLVTGASRGIGQAISVELSKKFGAGSVLLLLARTQSGLEETKKLVHKVNDKVNVVTESVDLQKAKRQEYQNAIQESLKNVKKNSSDFKRAILIHNAAGYSKSLVLNMEEPSTLQEDLDLNFISPILLNTQFFKVFGKDIEHRIVVQISSAASQMHMPSASIYGAIKSARNHVFATLAAEEPTLKVLNYDPGAVDTEMLRSSMSLTGQTIDEASKLFEALGCPILQPAKTAAVLAEYLEDGFESGAFLNAYKNPDLYKASKEKVFETLADVDKLKK